MARTARIGVSRMEDKLSRSPGFAPCLLLLRGLEQLGGRVADARELLGGVVRERLLEGRHDAAGGPGDHDARVAVALELDVARRARRVAAEVVEAERDARHADRGVLARRDPGADLDAEPEALLPWLDELAHGRQEVPRLLLLELEGLAEGVLEV